MPGKCYTYVFPLDGAKQSNINRFHFAVLYRLKSKSMHSRIGYYYQNSSINEVTPFL